MMFRHIFRKFRPEKKAPQDTPQRNSTSVEEEDALIRAIRERSPEDPLIGAKIGAREIFQRLLNGLKKEEGVHMESLLTILGSLSGYACQASLRAQAREKNLPETAVFQIVTTRDGGRYFFGDALNEAITGAPYSVWNLAAGAAMHAGAQEKPDLQAIFRHTAAVLGSEGFGIPRVPERHRAGDTPLHYVAALWPALLPTVRQFCPAPSDWPILYGLAIQHALYACKDVLDPAMALLIVMESCVPMSKVDLPFGEA